MTGYHITTGYNRGEAGDEDLWEELKESTRFVCDNPLSIIDEALRLGAPDEREDGYSLADFADDYSYPFGWEGGHPVRILEDDKQIMQLASTGSEIKYHVRRAFVRLLIEEMHKKGIEINLVVA